MGFDRNTNPRRRPRPAVILPPKPAATATEVTENTANGSTSVTVHAATSTKPTKKLGRPPKLLGNGLNGAPDIKWAWRFRLNIHVSKGKRADRRSRYDNDGRFVFKANGPRL